MPSGTGLNLPAQARLETALTHLDDDGGMKTKLLRYADLPTDMIDALSELRHQTVGFGSPFFDIEFAHQLSLVRDDTRIAIIYENDELAGYWPMHVRPGKWARPIGTAFSDWHGPVLRVQSAGMDRAEILSQCGLKGMTVNGLQTSELSVGREGKRSRELVTVGHALLGTGGADAFLAHQKVCFPKYAKNIRRAQRLVDKDFGGMTLTADDRTSETLDWVLKNKSVQYRSTGLHDVLAPNWVQLLMRNLHALEGAEFRGRLSTLRFGDRLVAAEFDLVSKTTIHGWITVFDDEYARYSPGHLLLRSLICDAERTGHSIIDVGGGDTAYKKYYCTYTIPAEAGTVQTNLGVRPLASAWRLAERALPNPVSGVLARIRRRTDQIAGVELGAMARVSGIIKSFRRIGRSR